MTSSRPQPPRQSFRVLRHTFSVETNDERLRRWLDELFEPLRTSAEPTSVYRLDSTVGGWTLREGSLKAISPLPAPRLLPTLMTTLNQRAAASTVDHLVLHAGVIGDERGAVLLVGRSGSGKSTLVAEATKGGWSYGGDEHAAVRYGSTIVDVVPKPIILKNSVRAEYEGLATPPSGLEALIEDQLPVAPARLGGELVRDGSSVRLMVLPRVVPGSGVEVEKAGAARALMELRAETFNWRHDARRGFETLAQLARRVPVLRVTFGHAAWALDAINGHGT